VPAFSLKDHLSPFPRLYDELVARGSLSLEEAYARIFSPSGGTHPFRVFRTLLRSYPRIELLDNTLYPREPFWYRTPWVILDLETTGHNPQRGAEVIEIALYKVQGATLIEGFVSFLRPSRPLPFWVTELTGISDPMVEDAPTASELIPRVIEFIGDLPFVAHNLSFDGRFLRYLTGELGLPFPSGIPICSLKLARRIYPFRSHSLRSLSRELYLSLVPSHRAERDVLATWAVLLDLFLHLPPEVASFQDLHDFARGSTIQRVRSL
jgi:DNA polymerase III epsilon subunit-like protein